MGVHVFSILNPPSHLPPHPIPQGHPSAPALSALSHASNPDWLFPKISRNYISTWLLRSFSCWGSCNLTMVFFHTGEVPSSMALIINSFPHFHLLTIFVVSFCFIHMGWTLVLSCNASSSCHLQLSRLSWRQDCLQGE